MKVNVSVIVNQLIDHGKACEIYDTLVDKGISPVVAREWANEPARRDAKRHRCELKKKNRKRIGAPGSARRRILYEFVRFGREWHYHATKGYRNYRPTSVKAA